MPASKSSSAKVHRAIRNLVLILTVLSWLPLDVFAMAPGNVVLTFSNENVLEGQSIRIYVNIANAATDTRGIVKFFDATKQVGPDQPFTVLKGKSADVFTDYSKLPYGERSIEARFVTFGSKDAPFVTKKTLFVDRDTDKDGIADRQDPDDDNDGVLDEKDAFPTNPKESVDTDGDKLGDNADPDDDNDGIPDETEAKGPTDPKKFDTDGDGVGDGTDVFPMDPKESADHDHDGIGDNADPDDDNDGVPDTQDALPLDPSGAHDLDHDGIPDERDSDIDGDGITNVRERELGTDPMKQDTDGDGVGDLTDAFPLDPRESVDTDHDGLGDNADPDDTNQGPAIVASVPERATLFFPYYMSSTGTHDPDGTIRSIAWIMDGNRIEKAAFWYFFVTPGKHSVIIEAIDDHGEMRTSQRTVNVSWSVYILLTLIAGTTGYYYHSRKRS